MTFESWLALVAAYTIISIIPGPSVLLVVNQALTGGMRAALMCLTGELLGGIVLIGLALFGVGAILAASSQLFQIVKWAGVVYMAYLGISQILSATKQSSVDATSATKIDSAASFYAGLFTAILNPKAVVFYVAFLSQFLNPEAPITTQFLIVATSSTAIVATVLGAYALLALRARLLLSNPRIHQRFRIIGGGCLLGGSMWIATTR